MCGYTTSSGTYACNGYSYYAGGCNCFDGLDCTGYVIWAGKWYYFDTDVRFCGRTDFSNQCYSHCDSVINTSKSCSSYTYVAGVLQNKQYISC